MLYVERDLAAVTKAVFDQWEAKTEQLNHQYLYVCDARVTPSEIVQTIARGTSTAEPVPPLFLIQHLLLIVIYTVSGKKAEYVVIPTTGVKDRDIMFELYNHVGMYPGKEIPDNNILALGVKLSNVEEFVREKLLPHLGVAV